MHMEREGEVSEIDLGDDIIGDNDHKLIGNRSYATGACSACRPDQLCSLQVMEL
jgi:hypothetical protein